MLYNYSEWIADCIHYFVGNGRSRKSTTSNLVMYEYPLSIARKSGESVWPVFNKHHNLVKCRSQQRHCIKRTSTNLCLLMSNIMKKNSRSHSKTDVCTSPWKDGNSVGSIPAMHIGFQITNLQTASRWSFKHAILRFNHLT